jgi:alkylhydroperoxidase/carboxymuconolactone decarboxylase family protein YurZ
MSSDPILETMRAATERDLWRLERLTPREKVFLAVTADVCQGVFGPAFAQHLARAEAASVTNDDLRDVIRHIAYDSGYHVASEAMARIDALDPSHADVSERAANIGRAASGTENPFPPFVRASLDTLGEGFGSFMARESRMRADAVSPLTVRERALTTLAIDILYQTLDDTFRIHATRLVRGGGDRETLRDALVFMAQFGATRAWNALRVLETLWDGLA